MSKTLPMVAIVGRPNVGKSSILNRLVGSREAIVAREAGTTRDRVQRIASHGGKAFQVIDTAGLHQTQSDNQQLSQTLKSQVEDFLAEADLILLVIDSTLPISQEERRLIKKIYKSSKKFIVVANKIDKTSFELPPDTTKLGQAQVIGTSATMGNGLADLLAAITQSLPKATTIPSRANTITLLGRSNVGKSTLFNAITGRPQAITASTPHTTRDVNTSRVKLGDTKFQLQDTGGIRKPSRRRGIEKFSFLRTSKAIAQSDICILVIDATEPSVAMDQKIAAMAKDAGRGLILAVNKWDVAKAGQHARELIEQKLQNDFVFAWWAPVVFVSAKTGLNVDKLTTLCLQTIKNRQLKVDGKILSALFEKITTLNRPRVKSKPFPVLKSIEQTATNPPTFTVVGAHLNKLHTSYRRYLESQISQKFRLFGTPIIIEYKVK